MDQERLRRQIALRMRANEAITAALAAADASAPSLGTVVEDTLESIDLACGDSALDPRDRLLLIDDAYLLIALLREVLGAPGPALILEVARRTNGLLRRHARFLRAAPGRINLAAE